MAAISRWVLPELKKSSLARLIFSFIGLFSGKIPIEKRDWRGAYLWLGEWGLWEGGSGL